MKLLSIQKFAASISVAAVLALQMAAAHADLEKLKQTGFLKVAVYKNFAPFSEKDGGIDIDLAHELAQKLGLKLILLPFDAGENLSDDLRNMVWKGHYLGYGPADLLMHVPVDRRLMEENKRAEIFAPYYRDSVRLVRDVKKFPTYESVDSLAGKRIGVEKISIAAMVLLGEQDGRFRDDVRIFSTAAEALEKLKLGELDAVLANRSEIESALKQDQRFQLSEATFPRLPRRGWAVGLSVKHDDVELAKTLQAAINELVASGEMAKIFAKYGVTLTAP